MMEERGTEEEKFKFSKKHEKGPRARESLQISKRERNNKRGKRAGDRLSKWLHHHHHHLYCSNRVDR